MPLIKVLQPFKFAHHGYQVEEFEAAEEPRETTQECADLAVAEGWAVLSEPTEPGGPPAKPSKASSKAAKQSAEGA
jgi:hypothetical protein